MKTVLGIDPGKDGAAVLLVGECDSMTLLLDPVVGGKRWEAVHAEVSGWLRATHRTYPIDVAILELHAGRPGEGAGSARTIGVGWGLWLGALSALGIHVVMPTSQKWTKAMLDDLAGEGKDRAVALCRARMPWLDLTPGRRRKPHTGIADAACLALYGRGRA
jgi:hypothetical protein